MIRKHSGMKTHFHHFNVHLGKLITFLSSTRVHGHKIRVKEVLTSDIFDSLAVTKMIHESSIQQKYTRRRNYYGTQLPMVYLLCEFRANLLNVVNDSNTYVGLFVLHFRCAAFDSENQDRWNRIHEIMKMLGRPTSNE